MEASESFLHFKYSFKLLNIVKAWSTFHREIVFLCENRTSMMLLTVSVCKYTFFRVNTPSKSVVPQSFFQKTYILYLGIEDVWKLFYLYL